MHDVPFQGPTLHFKPGHKTLEDILAGIRHGQSSELRNHDSVVLAVNLEGVTLQELALVLNSPVLNFKLVQQGHPIKPVVVSEKQQQENTFLQHVL